MLPAIAATGMNGRFAVVLISGLAVTVVACAAAPLSPLVTALPLALAVCAVGYARYPAAVLALIVALVPLDIIAQLADVSPAFTLTIAKIAFPPLLIGVVWRIAILREPLRWNRQATYVLLLTLALAVSALYMRESSLGLRGTRRYMSMALLFLVTFQVVRRRRDVEWITLALVISTMVSCTVGLYFYIRSGATFAVAAMGSKLSAAQGWSSRLTGMSMTDPNSFAALPASAFMISTVLAFHTRRVLLRVLLLSSLPVYILAIGFSYSRGAAVALSLGIVLLAWLYRRQVPMALSVGSMVLLALTMIPFLPDEFLARLGRLNAAGFITDHALRRRLSYHALGAVLFLRSPLTGLGPANFGHYYTMEEFRFLANTFQDVRVMHNTLFSVLLDTGILGFVPFVLVVVSAFRSLARADMQASRARQPWPYPRALLVGLCTYLICQLFLQGQYSKVMWVMFALAPACELLCRANGTCSSGFMGTGGSRAESPVGPSGRPPELAGLGREQVA
ncbi:MAG: hypothetical protein GF331_11365 [Chitinivibrionales bacterium]|nr:hypothetical protein [Chitinivibrionales bacterium]